MSDSFDDRNQRERRQFPRVKAQCPVNYFSRASGNWNQAVLEDYSASGICFTCDETLLQNTNITIQIRRDAHKEVPAIAASAVVVRCELDDDHQFRIACKFTRVRERNPTRISRFELGNS